MDGLHTSRRVHRRVRSPPHVARYGEAWGIFSPLIASHALSAVRAIRKGLDMLIDAQNLQRVQATVNASHPRALAFARSLGFREEGLMLKYHDGFDYWMVSKT